MLLLCSVKKKQKRALQLLPPDKLHLVYETHTCIHTHIHIHTRISIVDCIVMCLFPRFVNEFDLYSSFIVSGH